MSATRELTAEQRELVALGEGGEPVLSRVAVSADAGSGKTSTLVGRVAAIMEASMAPHDLRRKEADLEAPRILCVSFTERSAADLEERLSSWPSCEVYTIHGFCARVAREFGAREGLSPVFTILDAEAEDDLFRESFEKTFLRAPLPTGEHAPDVFEKICRRLKDSDGPIEVRTQAGRDARLSEFAHATIDEFEHEKKRAHALEYGDLEKYAVRLLELPEVAQILQRRFAHVFVDEFQDTNAIQCRIMRALVGPKGGLFVVGDEKQSIYRFRGADVDVFRAFVAELPARRRLSMNFRSDPAVIDAVNSVCAPIIPGYQPMRPGRNAGGENLVAARVTAETDADGVEAVLKHLGRSGVDPSSAVLLLRSVTRGERFLAELERRGYALAISASGSASLDPRMKALMNLWSWACEPWQKLRAAKVAVDFPEVASAARPAREALPELLAGPLDKIRAELFFGEELDCTTLLERLDSTFGLSRRFGSAFEAFELFVLRHQARGVAPARLATRLHRIDEEAGRIPDLVSLPPPPELKGALRVMTVHASKGLEFPYVILAGLAGRTPSGGPIVAEKKQLWLAGRDDEGDLEKWDAFLAAEAREKEAALSESARTLYVAMTRAERGLFAVSRADPMPDSEKPARARKESPKNWDEWIKQGLTKVIPASALAGEATASKSAPVISEKAILPPLSDELPHYAPARVGVTALLRGENISAPLGKAKGAGKAEGARFSGPDPRPARIGDEIHRLLQFEQLEALWKFAADSRVDLRAFREWLATEMGRKVFPPSNEPGSARVLREFAFDWKRPTETVTGRIDRLLIFGEGEGDEAWIIDYKTLFSKRSPGKFRETYAEQLAVYAEAIQNLTGIARARTFLLDVACATGSVWHEVSCD
ncbi:MAG: ATP-dependent helicase [Deltaproteobacteria bacterium]|nr:ATP-dependent helicase [Deltaproteobacteria bacterium]